MRGKGPGVLLLLAAAPAGAVESFAVETAWFVPELGQAWVFGVGGEGRFSGLAGQPDDPPWPTRGLRLDVGWLRYHDGHGRLAYGPTLGYGRSLADPLHPDAAFQHLAFGALLSALVNVNINLKYIKDETFTSEWSAKAQSLVASAQMAYNEARTACTETLGVTV